MRRLVVEAVEQSNATYDTVLAGLRSSRDTGLHRLIVRSALSPDGMFPEAGAATALRALTSVDAKLESVKFDLSAVYTNAFVKKAQAKYPKA